MPWFFCIKKQKSTSEGTFGPFQLRTMATPDWESTPWYDMNEAFGYIQIAKYAGSIINVETSIFESDWATPAINEVNTFLGQKNYAEFKFTLSSDFEKATLKKGFRLSIDSGLFKVSDITKFKIDDADTTPTLIKDNVIVVKWGKEKTGKEGSSGLKVSFRCVVTNPQRIASKSFYFTFMRVYNKEILSVGSQNSYPFKTEMKKLGKTMNLSLGWGVDVPFYDTSVTEKDKWGYADSYAEDPFKIVVSPSACKTPECSVINTMRYKFKVDQPIVSGSHDVTIFFKPSKPNDYVGYTLYHTGITSTLKTKHINTGGSAEDMSVAKCLYYYNQPMNYIKCTDCYIEKNTEYEIAFRLSLYNFEPSKFITELRVGVFGADIYNWEAHHDVVLADTSELNTGFFPLTGFPNYKKRDMTADDVGGNFGEVDLNYSDDKKWIPWVRPQITGNKQYWFRFKTTSSSYSSGGWKITIFAPKSIGNTITNAFIVPKTWTTPVTTPINQEVDIALVKAGTNWNFNKFTL